MTPEGKETFVTEDDQGEGYEHPLSIAELEDRLEQLQRKEEMFRRRKENKTVR